MNTPTFKMIHTADWHLGQKFLSRDRHPEHKKALDWLLQVVREEQIDLLLVAGDIFDIQSPPNSARQLYYDFLIQLKNTGCRHVVIIGGNHDSPSMLNAPAELLRYLDIHVVGSARDPIADQVIELKKEDGVVEAVVAAVPFLRDRDIRMSVPGESVEERLERVRAGIATHYAELADLVDIPAYKHIPIIATGHLYAKGASASADQTNIYIGDTENIRAADFPNIFDYVALGHLHREQAVEKQRHIRYSGSLIPLSFSEVEDSKSVTLVCFDGEGKLSGISKRLVPENRLIRRISGSFNAIRDQLMKLADRDLQNQLLPAWLEVSLENTGGENVLDQEIRALVDGESAEIVKLIVQLPTRGLTFEQAEVTLEESSPLEVFHKKLDTYDQDSINREELEATFRELLNWINEKAADENN